MDESLIRSEHLAVALSAGTATSTESEALRELTEHAARLAPTSLRLSSRRVHSG